MPGLIGRCGGNSCSGVIDSTATAGDTCGVHSAGAGAGNVLASDGAGGSLWTPAGGGYTPPTASEGVLSTAVITSGFQQPLALSHGNGSTLLDYTTATQPKILASGIYAFSFVASSTTLINAGNLCSINLGFSRATPPSPTAHGSNFTSPTGGGGAVLGVSCTLYMAAGDSFFVTIFNGDTANRTFRDITPLSVVQRIT